MPIPPHMWMFTIATSSALAGAVVVHLAHSRRAFMLSSGEPAAGRRDTFAKLWASLPRLRHRAHPPVSGNSSFDAHAAHVADELDKEQNEFETFRDQKRRARDRDEFQSFLSTRRSSEHSGPDNNHQ